MLTKQCSSCHRELTEQEVTAGNRQCYYCKVEGAITVAEITGTTPVIRPPSEFGRTLTYEQEVASRNTDNSKQQITSKSKPSKTKKSETTESLPKITFSEDLGLDPNSGVEEFEQPIGTGKNQIGSVRYIKDPANNIDQTIITVYGSSDNVSLQFSCPRIMDNETLLKATEQGMLNFMFALLSFWSYAPLSNGIMDYFMTMHKSDGPFPYPGLPKYPFGQPPG